MFVFAWRTHKISREVAAGWIANVEKMIAQKVEQIAAAPETKRPNLVEHFVRAVECRHKIRAHFKLDLPKSTANPESARSTLELIQSFTAEEQEHALLYLTSSN